MKKRIQFATAMGALGLALALAAPASAQGRNGKGPGPGVPATLEPATAEEARSLAFMREEEKLARDVYRLLGEQWKLAVFENIAQAEQRHFEAIGNLLARYGVEDPAANDIPGVYKDPELSALYAQLTAKGKLSAKDALEVGVMIEKADIEDLEKALAVVAKSDIKRVYTNLLAGSYDHLEAFENCAQVLAAAP